MPRGEKEMKGRPCYKPALPYNYCLNLNSDRVKRLDCTTCLCFVKVTFDEEKVGNECDGNNCRSEGVSPA